MNRQDRSRNPNRSTDEIRNVERERPDTGADREESDLQRRQSEGNLGNERTRPDDGNRQGSHRD